MIPQRASAAGEYTRLSNSTSAGNQFHNGRWTSWRFVTRALVIVTVTRRDAVMNVAASAQAEGQSPSPRWSAWKTPKVGGSPEKRDCGRPRRHDVGGDCS